MSIGRKAGRIGLATMLSRIFGLVREQVFAGLMGAGFYSDAFVNAFRIPNLMRDLFAEGALSNAFVPTFTEYRIQRSRSDAWALANRVLAALLVVVGGLTLLGIVFAPTVVDMIAPGLRSIAGKHELTVELTRIMMPFLMFVSIAALLMGMLNSYERYTLPALAPVLFNFVSIAAGILVWTQQLDPQSAVIGWSIGTLCAGFAQMSVQIPSLWSMGWRMRPRWSGMFQDPGLRQIFWLMVPAIVSNSGTQVNILVNSILASWLEEGSVSWLYYAFRIMQLPIGVFGVAISVVTLTETSKLAAEKDFNRLRDNLTSAIILALLLTLPCTLGLFVLADPIIRLIYEHGRFDAHDTLATASAIRYYGIGLSAYALVKVLAPVLFVFHRSKTSMIASLSGIAANIAFNLFFYRTMGHRGLALGTSIGMFINLSILSVSLHRDHVRFDIAHLVKRTLQAAVASIVMALLAFATYRFLEGRFDGLIGKFMVVMVPMTVAGVVYATGLWIFGIPEAKSLVRKLRSRLFG